MLRLFLAVALVMIIFQSCHPAEEGRGPLRDKWELENKGFRIRITEYEEKHPAFLTHFYYVFESMPAGESRWREVMTFEHDDDVSMRDQVRFVDDRIAYAFMGWIYAVTTDGGGTWSVWDAAKDLRNWECCNYRLIRAVQVAADGQGTMTLNPIPQRRGEVPQLHTRDYGQHWAVE